MKKNLLILLAILFVVTINNNAQNVVDFEELELSSESHWNGSDLSGGFTSKYLTFYNSYDAGYSSWMGWAYTNETDNTTYSIGNSYSSANGYGANNSENYAVAYIGSDWMNDYAAVPSIIKIDKSQFPQNVSSMSMSICLNANAYLYMQDDNFYQGNNHYLKLHIVGLSTESNINISNDFYLADFRLGTEEPFIMNEWTTIDMTWALACDSLLFYLESSDAGDYGINTPTYFCFDNFMYYTTADIDNDKNFKNLNIYANDNNLVLNSDSFINRIELFDILGRKIKEEILNNYSAEYNISNLNDGIYIVNVYSGSHKISKKIIKR